MAWRGRGRACLSQMRRDMKNLQRQVVYLTNMSSSQKIIQREVSHEEIDQRDVDKHTEYE